MAKEVRINIQYYDSPCGRLFLASFADKLCLCDWSDNPFAERNKRRLERYLKASLKTSAWLSTYRYVWRVLIFSNKCGTHC